MDLDLEALLAREAIRDLVARYNSNGDAGRFEPLLALFAEDAVMAIGWRGRDEVRRYEGREAIRAIFTGVRDDIVVPGVMRHHTSTHQIDLVDADHATGRLYFAVITGAGLDHWGRYVDRYARVDDRWCFAERVVTTEGYAAGSPFLHA